ncbi:hypothetical protein FHX80_112614 [Streptomyces brevispora]|uniref:Uncharacterized protein n=1 Tax=Streptomyces brevispora TaxID=887462 RepID=A0A561UXT0_9ACTN|nr:hypothetical protein FHX80_112614 [Streptomyces brevispora]
MLSNHDLGQSRGSVLIFIHKNDGKPVGYQVPKLLVIEKAYSEGRNIIVMQSNSILVYSSESKVVGDVTHLQAGLSL